MSTISRFLRRVQHRDEPTTDPKRKQYEYTPEEKKAIEKLKDLKGSVKL